MSARRLIALGVGAFIVLFVVTFPAQIVTSRLSTFGIVLNGVSGSLWQGRAASFQGGGISLGEFTWDLQVLKLLTGRAAASISLRQNAAFATGEVVALPTGRVKLTDFSASWPLVRLSGGGIPAGWTGTLALRLDELDLDNGVPQGITGTIDLLELVGPANRPAALGSYRVTFPTPGSNAGAGQVVGALQDLDGPIAMNGTVTLGPGRSYELGGLIATRPGAPADVVNALQYLGEPDGEGRRPFSVAGTF